MKPFPALWQIVFVFTILLTGSVLMAQDKEAEEKKQKAIQMEMQKAMQAEEEMQAKNEQLERQKALQAEEMKARKDLLEEQWIQQQDQWRNLEREYADQAAIFERQSRDAVRVLPSIHSTGEYLDGTYLFGSYGQENQSQLTLRKSFRGTTNTSKGEFDVEPGIRHFRCMISGSAKSGEILIGVEYPDGKTFKELVINASADINFSQSISIKEGEEKKYTGSWSYVIKADKAEGNYILQIMTN